LAELVSQKLPEYARVHIQSDLLQCFPSSDGMMHDELMAGAGSHHLHLFVRGDRRVDQGGTLHPTVIERLKMESVRNFVGFGKYRPTSLQEHPQAKPYYNNHQSRGDDTPQSDSVYAIADLHTHRSAKKQTHSFQRSWFPPGHKYAYPIATCDVRPPRRRTLASETTVKERDSNLPSEYVPGMGIIISFLF
jgi:hypothetical protein